jgi:hypothetical protein
LISVGNLAVIGYVGNETQSGYTAVIQGARLPDKDRKEIGNIILPQKRAQETQLQNWLFSVQMP